MELITEPAVLTAVAEAGPRDRLLTFLTRGQGGVRLYAKRLSRRLPSTVFFEPLQGGELAFVRSREGAQGRLFSFVPQRVWPGIRQDLGRTLQALSFLELVNLSLAEGEPLPRVFPLLVDFLNRLESDNRPGLARIVATLRLLVLSGFAPCLDSCVCCRAPVAAGTGVLLSPEGGGAICRACLAARRESTVPVTPGAHGFLTRVLALSPAQVRRLSVPKSTEREVSRLLDLFIEARTGVRPRSGRAIESLEAV